VARTISINGKAVQLRSPYDPKQKGRLIGRETEIGIIIASWMARRGQLPKAPLLIGLPGLGKSRLVYECAKLCGKELYTEQGHEDLTSEDLMGTIRPSDDPKKKFDYILSNLATAMIRGGVFFLDGIGKMRERALAPLESVLDERRYMDSSLLGARIHASPGFRFIAATNPEDLFGKELPDYIRSRIKPVIQIGYLPQEEINEIIRLSYPLLQDNAKLIDCFWKTWRKRNGSMLPTPRDAKEIFGYAQNVADKELQDSRDGYNVDLGEGFPPQITERHLEIAINIYFPDEAREKCEKAY